MLGAGDAPFRVMRLLTNQNCAHSCVQIVRPKFDVVIGLWILHRPDEMLALRIVFSAVQFIV